MLSKYLIYLGVLCSSLNISQAQVTNENLNPYISEYGIGYPIPLQNSKQNFESFLNLGYQKQIDDHIFLGISQSFKLRVGIRADFSTITHFRLGKLLGDKYNISTDLGYSLYSRKYKSFPGLNLNLNFEKTNKYGFHFSYEELKSSLGFKERNLIIGIHLSGSNTFKIGFPIIGGIAVIVGILRLLASQSL